MKRVHMQPTVAHAIAREATKRGAHASAVLTNRGFVDEVLIYKDGEAKATIYWPEKGKLAVLRLVEGAEAGVMPDVETAVWKALQPPPGIVRSTPRKRVLKNGRSQPVLEATSG